MNEPHATSRASATHFDAVASTWEADPGHTALARAVANEILEAVPLVGTGQAMEFGCGTGLVTGLLAPGGRVAFADLAKEDGSFHGPDVPGVMHHGFEPAELTRWLEAAGFADVRVRIAHRMNRPRADGSTREYPVLLVTAQRPAEP